MEMGSMGIRRDGSRRELDSDQNFLGNEQIADRHDHHGDGHVGNDDANARKVIAHLAEMAEFTVFHVEPLETARERKRPQLNLRFPDTRTKKPVELFAIP
jgi:hypothetical protein